MSSMLAGIFDNGAPKAHRERAAAALRDEPGVYVESSGPLTIATSGARLDASSVRSGLCAFDGYITNLAHICKRLALPPSTSPAVAVAELTRRVGVDALSEIRGRFVLALWDEDARRGVIATDHLGAGGLFYSSDGGRLLFGSEIRAVLGLLKRTPTPDEDTLTSWLAYDAPGVARTLYEGVRRLPGGHMIELLSDAWRIRRYWHLEYSRVLPGTVDEYAGLVRGAAAAAVDSRLARGATTGVLLSGGIDSSSIAALARESTDAGNLHAYSAVFPDDPEMDESRLVELVCRGVGIPVTTIAVRGGSILAPALEYLDAWRVPSLSHNLLFGTSLARAAADAGTAVLLDGEGGDELFGYSPYVFADLLMHGRLVRALRLANSVPGLAEQPRAKILSSLLREWAVKGALPYAVHKAARSLRPEHYGAPWLTRAAAQRHGRNASSWQWKRVNGPRWWASRAVHLTEGRQRSGAHDFLRHKSALGGLPGRHPYFEDLDLIERVLSIPPETSFDASFDRPLLRRAMEGRLPEEVRLRRQKSYFNALVHRVLATTDRQALLRLLDDRAAVAAYVRVDEVRSYLDDTPQRPASWASIVWRVASAECWLRTLDDPGFPKRALAEWRLEAPRLEVRRAGDTAALRSVLA
jgi:asparagine synthase (glutamine-hydrolysing)